MNLNQTEDPTKIVLLFGGTSILTGMILYALPTAGNLRSSLSCVKNSSENMMKCLQNVMLCDFGLSPVAELIHYCKDSYLMKC